MASIIRPALLRQSVLATSTRRAATTTFSRHQLIRPTIAQDAILVAAFHASSRRSLLPPGPQVIKGSVNDPAPVPDPHPTHGSYHWTFERLVAVGIIPLTVAPFAGSSLNPGLDAILCSLLLVHCHLGFQSVLIDYIPISRFPKSRKASMWLLNAVTALVGVGLYEFETNDVGVTEAVKRVWKA
ncbi:CybS-domain-containing protein [Hypoxylon trugodes]|uniref:CybS-domain-containing protein n=1 Tax=Hypoxylon trugodes TaxID=326681 RepID=UPI0021A0ACB6|nr:CybS-domain-containing protein [Hypoxylon trugodes]KAI1392954.1 CybS-domain-containing protein [Hypoxylon trugodes]